MTDKPIDVYVEICDMIEAEHENGQIGIKSLGNLIVMFLDASRPETIDRHIRLMCDLGLLKVVKGPSMLSGPVFQRSAETLEKIKKMRKKATG